MNRNRPVAALLLVLLLCAYTLAFSEGMEVDTVIDYHARAVSAFVRAGKLFYDASMASQGTLHKSAAAASDGAEHAANAVIDKNITGAVAFANRAKLDAVLAAAAIHAHNDIDAAIRRFDEQMAELERSPAVKRPELLAKAAERLAAIARVLRDAAIRGD